MESLLKCPACRARVRPGDEWCALCYARLTAPAPVQAVAAPAAPTPAVPAPAVPAPGGAEGAATPALPEGRRARREDLDQLAEEMLAQLAASQTTEALPGSLGRLLAAIGLDSTTSGARKAAGIAMVCAAMVALFTAFSWLAGLVL